MASYSHYFLLFLLLSSILLINHTAYSEDDNDDHDDHDDNHDRDPVPVPVPDRGDDEDNLIQGINGHRASLRLSPLTETDIADCLADEMADQLKNQPCTGPNVVPSTRPLLSNYPSLIAKCGPNASAVRDGVVLPSCGPDRAPNLVLSTFTTSPQYSQYLNDGKFSGIGVGTEDKWIVIVLTTNRAGGVSGGSPRGSSPPGFDDEDDEEDILLQGINSYRATLNLTALTENDKAECLADEIADQFNDQPCPATVRLSTTPVSNYRNLLAKCEVNVATTRDGVILPVCVPNLAPNQVLSNYTMTTQYSQYIKDSKFSGVGIGTEDNWMVVVLTTSTPTGSFIASQNVGNGVSGDAKVDSIYHLLALLIVGILMILM